MKKRIPQFVLGVSFLLSSGIASAQTDSLSQNIEDISLEDLMNVKIVSASKKEESQFDAPLSIGSVSRDEIRRSGATSIMEALRLIPGLIVRENTSGNYEVHLRGLDNLPPQSVMTAATNSITLVMIDNRPVYNYFNGGTFWETLPIDINDVDKIEVVRGPSSALYGPNAAAGVINILTRKPQKDGLYAVANAQAGTPQTVATNASLGYKFKKFDFILSGNQQYRERHQNTYYSWIDKEYMVADSLQSLFPGGPLLDANYNPNAKDRYPDPKIAQNKYGYNAFLNYNFSEKSNIRLSAGGQNSSVQRPFVDNLATPLSTMTSNSYYADLRAKISNLTAQFSYLQGTQDASKGQTGYKYDFNTFDAFVEYDINFKKIGLSLKPGINLRDAIYDDSKYWDVATFQGFLNGKRELNNYAGSLRAEFNTLKEKLKLIAAVRADKYNYPDKVYYSYQFAANYKAAERHLFRAVYSQAYRGPNMYDIYSSNSVFVGTQQVGPTTFLPIYADISGNKNIGLLGINMFELGYRVKATDNFHIDLDLFRQESSNYSFLVSQPNVVGATAVHIAQTVENISLKAQQLGATLGANFVTKRLQVKPFVTIQQTQIIDMPIYRSSVAANPTNNVTVTYDSTSKGTPSVYGGFYANYQITPKFNVNLNGYVMSNYTYISIVNSFNSNLGKVDVFGKVILNAKVSYKFFNKLDLFVNVRNLTNSTSYEFAKTDLTKVMFLGGANFEF